MSARPLPVVVDPAGVGDLVVGGLRLLERATRLLACAGLQVPRDRPAPGAATAALVLDVAHALAPAPLLEAVLELADRRPDAVVVPAREVTDTLKSVDEAGRVLATVDRGDHREVLTPMVLPAGLPGAAPQAPGWLPQVLRALAAGGVPVLTVPAPPDLVVVTRPDDLALVGA